MSFKIAFPKVTDNPDGWGPLLTTDGDEEIMKGMPYQPFSKADRIGKVADWMGLLYQDKKYTNKYSSQYGTGTQYAYFHEEEESGFHLVNTAKIPKPAYQRTAAKYRQNQQRNYARYGKNNQNRNARQGGRPGMNTGNMNANKGMNMRSGGPGGQMMGGGSQGGAFGSGPGGANRHHHHYAQQRFFRFATKSAVPVRIHRESSVRIRPEWKVLEEMDFADLNKMSLPNMDKPTDLKSCGTLEFYDKSYDRCSTRNARPLLRINRIYPQVTTTDDPIIREISRSEGNVFFTDTILATLMCATKSVYSWDIIAEKIMGKIFFDKRDTPEVDLLSVSETSVDPPNDDPESMNSVKNLAMEATYINHNFSQQVLKPNDEKYRADLPNPFESTNEEGEIAPKIYRYRKWDLGNNVSLIARTEIDAVQLAAENADMQFLNIKCLNEWDSRYSSGIDWRSKLDTQKTSILANELKNNSCKLAKWTASSILSGADFFKLGFVSRVMPSDSTKHVVLSVQQFRPPDLAQNINLNLVNCWGIVRYIIDRISMLPDGKFVIMKDPNKQCLRLYSVPLDAFSSSSSSEESSDSENEENQHNMNDGNLLDNDNDNKFFERPTSKLSNKENYNSTIPTINDSSHVVAVNGNLEDVVGLEKGLENTNIDGQ